MLGIPAEQLLTLDRIGLADSALAAPQASFGGVEFYPDFEAKAAVLCSRLARNHPLPDGNKRAAHLALREFVARNGRAWKPASVDETVTVIENVVAGDMSEGELAAGSPNGPAAVCKTPSGLRPKRRRAYDFHMTGARSRVPSSVASDTFEGMQSAY